MSSRTHRRFTAEEYLALERDTSRKSEFWQGEIFAMTGASREHNLIVTNLISSLHQQLRGRPCNVYPSDMRVRIAASGLYTYPDMTVTCGQERFDDERRDTLLNPLLIVEVLSKSTEHYDRGDKFAQYRQMDSLMEYLLVSQDRPRLEHYARQSGGRWLLTEVNGLDARLPLPVIDCELALREVYDKVDLA